MARKDGPEQKGSAADEKDTPVKSPKSNFKVARKRLKRAAAAIGLDRITIGAGFWLLWVGIGINASLSSMGYHWVYGQSISLVFFAIWGVHNVDASQVVLRTLFAVLEIFFKDFDVAGLAKLPTEGPVILACAPHNSQFVDGLCVLKALQSRKDVGLLTAAVTLRRKFVGSLAKLLGAIPVERPQDLAKKGSGSVRVVAGELRLQGTGTQFTKETTPKCLVKISDGPNRGATAKVREVLSDTELILAKPLIEDAKGASKGGVGEVAAYKVIPHLDQKHVFEAVFAKLRAGHVVGIFPEGGSHDRTSLLPLKAGISIMALGAMDANPGLKVPILPVGINYFRGHRFRSRVFVDIGSPISPTAAQLADFKAGGEKKRKACKDLLDSILAGIRSVTIEAPDFKTLQFFRAMRRLYWDGSRKMTAIERFGLTSAFARGYDAVKDEKEVKKLYDNVQAYRGMLKTYAINDYRVQEADAAGGDEPSDVNFLGKRILIWLIAYRLLFVVLYIVAAIPGAIAAAPFFYVSRVISARKAKAAAKRSSVKLEGRDLLATWKVMISLVGVPLLHLFYTLLFLFFFGETPSIVYFFFMPFVSLLTVRSTEQGVKVLNSIKPLFYAIINRDAGTRLVAKRRQMREEVLSVVKKYNWDRSLKDDAEVKHLYRRLSEDLQDTDALDTCLG